MGYFSLRSGDSAKDYLENSLNNLKLYRDTIDDEGFVYLLVFIEHDIKKALEKCDGQIIHKEI